MMLLLEGIELVQAVVHLLHTGRVELHLFEARLHLVVDVLQFDEATLHALLPFIGRGIYAGNVAQVALHLLQGANHPISIVGREALPGGIKSALYLFRMIQTVGFGFEFLLFALLQIQFLQLLQLEGEVILIGTALFGLLGEGVQFGRKGFPMVERLLVGGQLIGIVRQNVHHTQLETLFA